jgi:hypothetical protein
MNASNVRPKKFVYEVGRIANYLSGKLAQAVGAINGILKPFSFLTDDTIGDDLSLIFALSCSRQTCLQSVCITADGTSGSQNAGLRFAWTSTTMFLCSKR